MTGRLLLLAFGLLCSTGAVARKGKGRGARPALKGPTADKFTAAVDAAVFPAEKDQSCHARDGFDVSGDAAFVWGLSFHVRSAADCCRACSAHQKVCGRGTDSRNRPFWNSPETGERRCSGRGMCNAWVFCGGKQCFSYDVHNHTRGE